MPPTNFLILARATRRSDGETANHIAKGHCILWVMVSATILTPTLARFHVHGSNSQANIGAIRTITNASVIFW